MKKIDGRAFYEKIKNTGFYNKNRLEVLFNLYLVLRGGRPAWLLEIYNNESEHFLQEIISLFNEYIDSTLLSSGSLHTLIYQKNKSLPEPPDQHEEWSVWLGNILGFFCPHDITDSYLMHDRYSIQYFINGQQFYAEICRKNMITKEDIVKKVKNRLQYWQVFANELSINNLRFDVTCKIKTNISVKSWYQLIKERNFKKILKYTSDLESLMYDSMLPDSLIEKIFDFDEKPSRTQLDEYYNWILMGILMIMHEDELMKCFTETDIKDISEKCYKDKIVPAKYLIKLSNHVQDNCETQIKSIIKQIFIEYKKYMKRA